MTRDAVDALLCRVRRRLWLEAALARLRPAAWTVGGILLVTGSVDLALTEVPRRAAAGAALAGFVVVLAPLLWSRPRALDCALRADRHFGGEALLTTALEVKRQAAADRSPAGLAVLREASRRSDEWRARVGSLRHRPAAGPLALAAIPAFAGILLLESGTSLQVARDEETSLDAGASPAAPVDPLQSDVALADLREQLQRASLTPAAAREASSGDPVPAAPAEDGVPPAGVASERAGDGDARLPGTALPGAAAGAEPGAARRPRQALSPAEPAPGFPVRDADETPIARYGEARAASAASGMAYAAGDPPGTAPGAARAAAAPPAPDHWTTLTAAEVAYAKRYLEADAGRD